MQKKLIDEPQPTEKQVSGLCQMMHNAFVEIRILAGKGSLEQAGALSNAFHELPACMLSGHFKWSLFRESLATYQNSYGSALPYLHMLDNIQDEKQLPVVDPL